MKTILSVLFIVIIFAGAYLMGNAVLDTFQEYWQEQILSSLFGLLIWALLASIVLLVVKTYEIAMMFLENFKL
jgi:hypothetical protein